MSPETAAFLDEVRDAEDPTPEDQRRVRVALQTAVVTTALTGGVGLSKSAKLVAWLAASPGVKIGIAAVSIAAAIGGAEWHRDTSAPETGSSEPASLPLTASSALTIVPSAIAAPTIRVPNDVAPNDVAPNVPSDESPTMLSGESPASAHRAPPSDLIGGVTEPSAPPSLGTELSLLKSVQTSLRNGDPDGALQKLDEHQTEDNQLSAERMAVRVQALCAAGRAEEARTLANAFMHQFPHSIHRVAIASTCRP